MVVGWLALSGCSSGADQPVDGEQTASAGASAETSSAAPESPSAGPEVAADQQFALEDTAEFDDGLAVQVAGTSVEKAKKTDRGAEGTDGEIVIASVLIENNTEEAYDPTSARITASYGDRTPAPMIIDPTGELGTGFSDVIGVADEGVAGIGFAIPVSQLKKVTFVVDLRDDEHDPVSFSGTVQRE